MSLNYDIVSSGSQGNCLILDNTIAVDMGVPFKAIRPWAKSIQLVLLTHEHGDHFNQATIKSLSDSRPSMRFAVPPWLSHAPAAHVDVCMPETWYDYRMARIRPIELFHDAPNVAWCIEYAGQRILYATDTCEIDHINDCPDLDYYFIEANHSEDEILERIQNKEAAGEFAYERGAMENHLSKDKADRWLLKNAAEWSTIEYMHQHK